MFVALSAIWIHGQRGIKLHRKELRGYELFALNPAQGAMPPVFLTCRRCCMFVALSAIWISGLRGIELHRKKLRGCEFFTLNPAQGAMPPVFLTCRRCCNVCCFVGNLDTGTARN